MRHHQLILRGHLAFTLAELLIALLIVMILIALLLPVLRHARRTVKEIACGNNLHQAGLALFNYAVDHDDYLHYGDRRIPPNHQRIAYAHNSLDRFKFSSDGMVPYISGMDLFYCPTALDGPFAATWRGLLESANDPAATDPVESTYIYLNMYNNGSRRMLFRASQLTSDHRVMQDGIRPWIPPADHRRSAMHMVGKRWSGRNVLLADGAVHFERFGQSLGYWFANLDGFSRADRMEVGFNTWKNGYADWGGTP